MEGQSSEQTNAANKHEYETNIRSDPVYGLNTHIWSISASNPTGDVCICCAHNHLSDEVVRGRTIKCSQMSTDTGAETLVMKTQNRKRLKHINMKHKRNKERLFNI